jgi:hypothetical protein
MNTDNSKTLRLANFERPFGSVLIFHLCLSVYICGYDIVVRPIPDPVFPVFLRG